MTELIAKVRQKAALEEQQMELLQERKTLKKEVFDRKITAHNEQADVEAMEGFSVKGLLLQITGKREELLEEERREARTAKAQYELADARLEHVNAQLAQIAQALSDLDGCEEALSSALREGQYPCAEEEKRVRSLEAVLKDGICLQENGEKLQKALNTVLSWAGTNPVISGVSGGLQQAKAVAQGRLNEYMGLLEMLYGELTALGYSLDTQEGREFGRDYLLELFTEVLINSRCDKIEKFTLRIGWQWKALVPKLEGQLRSARIDWMNAMCRAGKA